MYRDLVEARAFVLVTAKLVSIDLVGWGCGCNVSAVSQRQGGAAIVWGFSFTSDELDGNRVSV